MIMTPKPNPTTAGWPRGRPFLAAVKQTMILLLSLFINQTKAMRAIIIDQQWQVWGNLNPEYHSAGEGRRGIYTKNTLFHVDNLICTAGLNLHRCDYYLRTWVLRYCDIVDSDLDSDSLELQLFLIIHARVCSSANYAFGVRQSSTGFKWSKLRLLWLQRLIGQLPPFGCYRSKSSVCA